MDASVEQDSERRRGVRVTPPATRFADFPVPLAPQAYGARVLIVSGLRLLRDGLADALGRSHRIPVVAAVGDADRARAAIAEHEPQVVLIDVELPDSLALVREIRDDARAPRIVVFAVAESDGVLVRFIESGIHGYVARDGALADVVATVESVSRGETIVSPKLAASLFQRLAEQRRRSETEATVAGDLTLRERQILALVEQGMANKEIARTLGIELATVKNHVHHVLEKLNVSRRGEAAARARDNRRPSD